MSLLAISCILLLISILARPWTDGAIYHRFVLTTLTSPRAFSFDAFLFSKSAYCFYERVCIAARGSYFKKVFISLSYAMILKIFYEWFIVHSSCNIWIHRYMIYFHSCASARYVIDIFPFPWGCRFYAMFSSPSSFLSFWEGERKKGRVLFPSTECLVFSKWQAVKAKPWEGNFQIIFIHFLPSSIRRRIATLSVEDSWDDLICFFLVSHLHRFIDHVRQKASTFQSFTVGTRDVLTNITEIIGTIPICRSYGRWVSTPATKHSSCHKSATV